MTNPVVHAFPVRRPGFITQVNWIGGDEDLSLQVSYLDSGGVQKSMSFQTKGEEVGEICLPSSNDVDDLGPRKRDILVAHTRMACMVAGLAVPGSKEFSDAFTQTEANNLQTALGTVKVTDVVLVDDQCLNLEYRQGTGPKRVIQIDHGELNKYVFAPSTQLLIIPGAVKKQFGSAVHDYPSTVLSQSDKDDIAAYVLDLAPWI